MNIKLVLVALCMTLVGAFFMAQPLHAEGEEGIQVVMTAYTCENHPNNPMYPCGPLRWGGRHSSPGMACPVGWKNRYFEVPGYGIRRCDDTGRYDTWDGLPHIDVRVATYAEARRIATRRITIYSTTTPPPAVPPPAATAPAGVPALPAPAAPNTPASGTLTQEGAMALARAAVPLGDPSTAVVREVRYSTAQTHFPWIRELVAGYPNDRLWFITLWQPHDKIPADARAYPNADDVIATTLVIINTHNNNAVTTLYVNNGVLDTLGWLTSGY